jgi:hypothetical protein
VAIVAAVMGSAGCVDRGAVGARTEALTTCAPATAAWGAGQRYAVGDEVLFGGQSYQCLQAHTAEIGWEPSNAPALWARPTPCDVAPWTSQTLYVVGSRVTFGGVTYQCLQAHQSLVGWEPPNAPALWSASVSTTFDVWPNAVSRANSDPWLVAHHDDIALVRPNVLVLLYANPGTADGESALVNQVIAGLAEGSRSRGYADASATPQLQYQPRFVDLRDGVDGRPQPPPGYPYQNSTLFPRKPAGSPGWGVDYARFFAADYAPYLGYPDPAHPGQFRDLCALVNDGTVNELWMVGSADVPDANAAEVLGMMPNYDEAGNQIAGSINRCAGNGCFDPEVRYCGRSLRIGFVNYNRGPGCYLHSHGHGIEFGVKDSVRTIQDWFLSYAGFDLDGRYGLPFNNLYQICTTGPCVQFPTPTHATFLDGAGRFDVDPFDAVCGNVHFPPNGTSHYDYFDPVPVLSSCTGFGRHAGPGGGDAKELVDPSHWAANSAFGDCGGEYLVWWYQNMPAHASGQTLSDGRAMKSIWPALFY